MITRPELRRGGLGCCAGAAGAADSGKVQTCRDPQGGPSGEIQDTSVPGWRDGMRLIQPLLWALCSATGWAPCPVMVILRTLGAPGRLKPTPGGERYIEQIHVAIQDPTGELVPTVISQMPRDPSPELVWGLGTDSFGMCFLQGVEGAGDTETVLEGGTDGPPDP